MIVFQDFWNFLKNAEWSSKIVFVLAFLALFITIGEFSYTLYKDNLTNVTGEEYLGLPAYLGSCPTLVTKAYDVLKQSGLFEQTSSNSKEDDIKNYNDIHQQVVNISQLSQFCEDPEAQGRVLYIAASIELIGGSRHIIPMNQVLYIVSSQYTQAEILGYNRSHPNEAYWLRERIERNAHHANYKLNLPPPIPVIPVATNTPDLFSNEPK